MKVKRINSKFSSKKRTAIGILALVWISIAAAPTPADDADKWVVVLDAGHGGTDPGNLGTKRYKKTEKDVSLDVTLMVGEYLEELLDDVKVIYTRKDDSSIKLHERVDLANSSQADLFVSIHCNSASPQAYGTETFVMGLHKSEASLKTAMKENASMFLEDDYKEKYAGFDPKDPDTYIALSLRQNIYLDQSLLLSKNVQDQFRDRVGRRDRGVKQAGYYVISFTSMPSALIELGFLTNKKEEDYLHSKKGKDYMASAIFRAIRDYKEQTHKGVELPSNEAPTLKDPEKDKPVVDESTVEALEDKTEDLEGQNGHEMSDTLGHHSQVDTKDAASLIASSMGKKGIKSEGLVFAIQFKTSAKPLTISPESFNGLSDVDEYISNGFYKYVAMPTSDFERAKENQRTVRAAGYADAFMVAFENGERIGMKQALKRKK